MDSALALRLVAVEVLGAAADDAQPPLRGARGLHLVDQAGERAVHQKRSSSGKGSRPFLTCIFPYSAQR